MRIGCLVALLVFLLGFSTAAQEPPPGTSSPYAPDDLASMLPTQVGDIGIEVVWEGSGLSSLDSSESEWWQGLLTRFGKAPDDIEVAAGIGAPTDGLGPDDIPLVIWAFRIEGVPAIAWTESYWHATGEALGDAGAADEYVTGWRDLDGRHVYSALWSPEVMADLRALDPSMQLPDDTGHWLYPVGEVLFYALIPFDWPVPTPPIEDILAGLPESVGETSPAEIWDPTTKSFSLAGFPAVDRFSHVAARLDDGRVLIVGGGHPGTTASLATAEIWDPGTGEFGPAAAMATPRTLPALTILADGRLLVSGGVRLGGEESTELSSMEVWDPASERFADAGRLIEARAGHSATLLPDGTVLIAGGIRHEGDDLERMDSVETWDSSTGGSSATSGFQAPRSEHAAVLLPDGDLLIVGGTVSVPDEVRHHATGRFEFLESSGRERRYGHTASLLPDGQVLLLGGLGRDDAAYVAELWDAQASEFVEAGVLEEGRFKHTATVLPDGRVLVVGGRGLEGKLPTAWLWDPATHEFRPAGSMAYPRSHHTATLLADGRVLIVGGAESRDKD